MNLHCHLLYVLVRVCPREAAVLVTSVGIQKGDFGSVIVGGREIDPENVEQSVDR